MNRLSQDQFQLSMQLQAVLGGYLPQVTRKVGSDNLQAMCDRLASWSLKAIDVKNAVETLINRDDEKFPTANQIRDIIKGRANVGQERQRDPLSARDYNLFQERLSQFTSLIGKDGIELYYKAWLGEFFSGNDALGMFKELFDERIFLQLAIADLQRAYGNPKRALEMVRAEKQRQPDYSGEVYENSKYLSYRGRTVKECSFTIKEGA